MQERLNVSPAVTATPQQRRDRKGLRKLLHVLVDELHAIHPRYLLVQCLVSLLPHNSLCRVRAAFYRLAGIKIGKSALILGKLTLAGDGALGPKLTIGARCRINTPFFAELNAPIVIGDRVAIGHHVVFVTSDHDTSDPAERSGAPQPRGIVIEDGAWVGASVTVLPGVTIGRGSVVAAGSLVAQSVPPNKLVGGVPARTVKALEG